jgi:hypothetical protein
VSTTAGTTYAPYLINTITDGNSNTIGFAEVIAQNASGATSGKGGSGLRPSGKNDGFPEFGMKRAG